MIPTKQKIMEARTKILEEGETPNTVIINQTDYTDSDLGISFCGMKIVTDCEVPKGKCYLIDTTKVEYLPVETKKKPLYQKIKERIMAVIRAIKYGDTE